MMPRLLALLAALAALACTDEGPRITQADFEIVVDGRKVADAHEVVRTTALGGAQVQRSLRLVAAPTDAVLELASLDSQGFASAASYRREGKRGKRYVELKTEGERRWVFSRGDDETLQLPALPVVLLSTQHRVKPAPTADAASTPGAGSAARDVVLLDLERATFRLAKLNAQGRVTPTAPPRVSATDAPRPEHSAPAPFIESGTAKVVSWCKSQAADAPPREAARLIALATKPKLQPERENGPPSALMAVQIGGGDQAGAALLTACLRALGHPARVVSGRAGDQARSWAQVFVKEGAQGAWLDVDALDIDLQGKMQLPHLALVEGLPGPLTTALLQGAEGG